MQIAIGTDHRGYEQKKIILDYYHTYPGVDMLDFGAFSDERTDYPIYAQKVVASMQKGEADKGILLCGSGIGMAIAANRHDYIYAGVVWNEDIARHAREHDNVNVLVLPSDYIANDQVIPIISSWLKAAFFQGRYQERLLMIDE